VLLRVEYIVPRGIVETNREKVTAPATSSQSGGGRFLSARGRLNWDLKSASAREGWDRQVCASGQLGSKAQRHDSGTCGTF
jgi:hypothetical protein